jgi:predicted dehydrogenase
MRRGGEHAALVSLGVHDLDLVAHLTASPVALRDVAHVDDDRADLVLVAARGAVAWVHVDRRARERERTIEVVTKDAVFAGDLLAKTLVVRHGKSGVAIPCALASEEPLVAQAAAIGRALLGSPEAVATGVEGARALAIVEQATTRQGTRPDVVSPAT